MPRVTDRGALGLIVMTAGTLQLLVMGGCALPLVDAIAGLAPLIDPDDHRQSRPQLAQFGAIVVEHNAHGHTLHDLGEVAGCILRRDDAELGARRRSKTGDVAMKGQTRYGISDDLGRLAFAHACELAFLEIGIDPQAVRRHDGQELGANRRIGADARTAIADDPVDWRTDFRVAQIEARQIAISVGLIDVSRTRPRRT